jgi:phosphatidylserine/phosphatidylglycerophosphate/cardiolipin synthase-like enzyme
MTDTFWDGLASYAAGPFPHGWPTDRYVFFSPRDTGVHHAIADVIGSAQHSIRVNMFGYDDDDVDAALHGKAADPNVFFQMSLDSSQAGGVHERALLAPWAAAMGTTVAVGRSEKHAISHLKVAVVDGLFTISGSTNWSTSGEQQQDNELVIQRDPLVAARYSAVLDINHAEMLKQMAAKKESK